MKDVEELVGEGRIVPVTPATKNVSLRELLVVSIGGQIDLFPWLLIAVLLALVLEGFIANRFYRRMREGGSTRRHRMKIVAKDIYQSVFS